MKSVHGPSLYYASDKNVFDALNQHKVDNTTIGALFKERNTLVSNQDERLQLAEYFSRLTHDYFDHQRIADRLGVAARRERITSMALLGDTEQDNLDKAVNALRKSREDAGDTVHVEKIGNTSVLHVAYTTVDYRLSEFSQVQHRDATIEIIKLDSGVTVRNTKNDYVDEIRDDLVRRISKDAEKPLERREISLFGIPNFKLRSKFFFDLANSLPGYSLFDVTSVYVYKEKPSTSNGEEDEIDTHIERVFLRGHGVNSSELLSLLSDDQYYIVRMSWRTRQVLDKGHHCEIEATFADPKDCTGFSFLLAGVHEFDPETGKISEKRRMPTRIEIDEISRVVEKTAAEVMARIESEAIGEPTDATESEIAND